MVDVSAKHAAESFSVSGEWTDSSTSRTSLRGVRGRNFHELTSAPSKLVLQHVSKLRPSSSSNATSEAVVPEHALDVELLDDDRTVALSVGSRQFVQDVFALSLDLAVDTARAIQGFCSVLGSFLPSRHDSLSATEFLQSFFQVLGIRFEFSIGISEQVGDAAIDGHRRNNPRPRIGDFVLAQETGKPLVAVPSDRAGLRNPFEGTVDHDLQGFELGEVQLVSEESPSLGMRLAESDYISSLSLPARLVSQLLETSLPSLVQLYEQLSAYIARNLSDPWKLGSQSSQFVDLIKRCDVLPLAARTRKSDQPLLVGNVPQKPQGVLPANQDLSLLPGWVDPKSKTLANEHRSSLYLVYATVKRLSNRAPCSFLSHCTLGLRAEIQEASHLAESLRSASRCLDHGMHRLRVRTQGSRLRERPRPPARRLPSQGSALHLGQLPERGLGSNASSGSVARSSREDLGRTFLVPFVLRRFVRRGSPGSCQTVRGTTTREPRFLPSLKGGVSARKTR
jgi:hypothetical protein